MISQSTGYITLYSIFSLYPHCSHWACYFHVKPKLNKTSTTWCQEHLHSLCCLWYQSLQCHRKTCFVLIHCDLILSFACVCNITHLHSCEHDFWFHDLWPYSLQTFLHSLLPVYILWICLYPWRTLKEGVSCFWNVWFCCLTPDGL